MQLRFRHTTRAVGGPLRKFGAPRGPALGRFAKEKALYSKVKHTCQAISATIAAFQEPPDAVSAPVT